MPSVSERQARTMAAAAHDPAFAHRVGISQKVATEFNQADKGTPLLSRAMRGLAHGGAVDAALAVMRRQFGGGVRPEIPYFERQEARDVSGYGWGYGSGRFDKNAIDVGAGSYVLPADVVSGLGEGNSLAGARVWDEILHTMPYGISPPQREGHRGPPAPPHDPELAKGMFEGTEKAPISPEIARGGNPDAEKRVGEKVPIMAADGEIIVHPQDVARVGLHYWPAGKPITYKQALSKGSSVLDEFVREVRGRTIKKLAKLPGPKGSTEASRGHN